MVRRALLSVPFPLTLRNFLPTGLAAHLRERCGVDVQLVSPYQDEAFSDPDGRTFRNHGIIARPGPGGLPHLNGVSVADRIFKSIHLTGFAIEYPDGSLQNLTLTRRRNAQWMAARALTAVAPRGTRGRDLLRRAYARYLPKRGTFVELFDKVSPHFVVVSSPGHFWLDHFMLDEARRRGIPSFCILLSWDNLYSRGPLCRRPDYLLLWSAEMRRQAMEVHQFPADRLAVVGSLQFKFYAEPTTEAEVAQMRQRIGLRPGERYLAYVCGARTATYDVEDVGALLRTLRSGPFGSLRIVVRPHPQGNRREYATLRDAGVLLDDTLDITPSNVRPDVFDSSAARHMAALLKTADFVISSWGTTALLEACIFDRPAAQLRWMDTVPHSLPEQVQLVRDFQRYIHMRAFDATGARLYCDHPSELESVLKRLQEDDEGFRERRGRAVERLTCLPLGAVIDRVGDVVESVMSRPQ
jgi:hypothetical protein